MEKFGKRLESLREKHDMTKKEVSFKLGFTANVYGSYERGDRRPSLETIIKLSDMYNVSIDYLIRGEEFQNNSPSNINISTLERLIQSFYQAGIDNPYVLRMEEWDYLTEDDFRELTNHFEWVVQKAKERERRISDKE